MPAGNTTGTDVWPPHRYRAFAAWLTNWSIAQYISDAIVISTMGRIPVIAAPTAAPTNPASEIGVSSTRPSPTSSARPYSDQSCDRMSSPITKTRSSRSISSRIASWMASRYEISRGMLVPNARGRIEVVPQLGCARVLALLGEPDRLVHFEDDLALNLLAALGAVGQFHHPRPHDLDGVPPPPLGDLLVAPVPQGKPAELRMLAVPVGLCLDQGRAAPFSRPCDCADDRPVDRTRVLAVDDRARHAVCRCSRRNVLDGDRS